jgi:hypothetical protein
MRRLILAAGALAALVTAGLAAADGIGTRSIVPLTATFSAPTISQMSVRTCSNADGSWTVTRARYSGSAQSSDPDLNGPVTFAIESVINTTKNLGIVRGRGVVDVSGPDTTLRLAAVYSGGKAAGLIEGRAHSPEKAILANVSFDLGPATSGIANGKLGDTAGGAAVGTERGRCQPSQAVAEKVEAKGRVSAVSASSITVAGVTCSVPPGLASAVSGLATGDEVRISCRRQDDQLVLTKVEKRKKK